MTVTSVDNHIEITTKKYSFISSESLGLVFGSLPRFVSRGELVQSSVHRSFDSRGYFAFSLSTRLWICFCHQVLAQFPLHFWFSVTGSDSLARSQ
jgi:hypothetical protein